MTMEQEQQQQRQSLQQDPAALQNHQLPVVQEQSRRCWVCRATASTQQMLSLLLLWRLLLPVQRQQKLQLCWAPQPPAAAVSKYQGWL
jgi:hypothetical protein